MKNDRGKSAESTPSSPRIGKKKLYFFWCLLVILSLVAMELVSFTIIKLTRRKGFYRDRVGQVRNPYHPYLGYVHAPNMTYVITKKGLAKEMSLTTDENGYSTLPFFRMQTPRLRSLLQVEARFSGSGLLII